MTTDFPGTIPATIIDDYIDTAITLSCYRETNRLDRMLMVFHKCLTIVNDMVGSVNGFRGAIRKLHDSKGTLCVTWRSHADFLNYYNVPEKAWHDCAEQTVLHLDRDGLELKLPSLVPTPGFEQIGQPAMRVLRGIRAKMDGGEL